jgi:PAS domain-containing protein
MRVDWRAICGPGVTMATALIAIALDRHFTAIPDPAPLFVCIVAFAALSGGLASGMISAAIAVACSSLFLLTPHATPGHGIIDLFRLALLATTTAGAAGIAGLLRKKMRDAHHSTAERLSAALDQVDIGIVLLDTDTRAEFINRAFRDYFSLPDEKADNKPPFIALMYHGRDTGVYELPEEELAAFIARRTAMMRSGDETPIDINLADGKVLRLHCTALPDGGRMLSYTPVTDLVRHTDHRSGIDHDRTRHLRAAE